MTLDEVNSLDTAAFVGAFGGIAEHTPWVAARAALSRPYERREGMVDAFQAVLSSASRAEQEALIRAHPDLAGRTALAPSSQREQAGAGLDALSAGELAQFTALNARYREKFGFPFILAVRGATRHQILDAFAARVEGGREEEFFTALVQVMRIIRFRLEDRIDG
jgi:2-oxo-4-hydroxy-4-carboxy-5-ureidoimidazoline decarboxylase